ncbi:MAG: AAA family ATPase [Planctomycetes bacterium]|nr:AAA family ATPase [Planctomycetota bacterium]
MSSDGSMVMYSDSGGASVPGYRMHPEEQRPPNLLLVVHRHLRGRYLITILLSLIGGLGGAAAGYLLPQPKFRAEGMIRVQPVMPRVLYQSEESTLQPMFASFVSTQASLLQHSRVQLKAMSSAAWRELGRPQDALAEEKFRRQLSVRTGRETPELIFVEFSDENAKAALVAVQEVIRAYQELFGGAESKSVREMQISLLTTRKQTLEAQMRDLENRLRAASAEFETTDLTRLSDHYLTQSLAFDSRVADLTMKLTEAGIDPASLAADAAVTDESQAGPSQPPTPEQQAVSDPAMAKLLSDRDLLRREIDRLKGLYKEDHRVVQRVQKEYDSVVAAIEERSLQWAEPSPASSQQGNSQAAPSRQELINSYLRLRHQADMYRAKAQAVEKARGQMNDISRDVKSTQDLLDEVNKRLDQIGVESKVQDRIGRIEVILPDAPPSTPNDDPRMKLTAMGLLVGGGGPLFLMFLVGMLDSRFRFSDQTSDAGVSADLLGVLPHLPNSKADPEQVAAAVHTVHHIRTRLKIADPSRRVFAITSPVSGDGKTTLALSLAISHVAAGSRTLLVDFDLVGRGLTRRLGVEGDHGIAHYLVFPGAELPSRPTPVPGLTLLPAGRDDSLLLNRVTPEMFTSLLSDLKGAYDVIVVDSGPILGSLEANICAAVADAVILVVGRGMRVDRVKEAIGHLRNLGARVAGVVFNRANSADFNRSSVASVSARSVRSPDQPRAGAAKAPPPGADAFDSLARSMTQDLYNSGHES